MILRMLKYKLTIGFIFFSFNIFSQKAIDVSVFAGPNITNVVKRFNGTPSSANATSNPRSFNSVNYLLGLKLEKENLYQGFNLRVKLLYEKIRSSSNSFNDSYKPVIDENINYIGTNVEISKAPLRESQIKFGIGGFFYYAINKRFGRRDLFVEKRPLWGPITSIMFPISKKMSFSTSFSFSLNNITNQLSLNSFTVTQNVYSFQFVLAYKLFDIVQE